MDGGDSTSTISGDVSSAMAPNEEAAVPLADGPELPQPDAWPPMGPTENDAALCRQFICTFHDRLAILRQPLGGPNTGSSVILFHSTPRVGGGGEGEGGDPRHGDADADAGGDNDDSDDDDDFSFGAVPASGVAIACLPETTVGDGNDDGGEARGECAVCLEEYSAGDAVRTMPCGHGFHERCIFGWLRASRLCPLCRFALPAEEEDTDADNVEEVGRDGDGDQGQDDDDNDEELYRHLFAT